MANVGIMHAAHKTGGMPLCGTRRAHMSKAIEDFRKDETPCKRCLAKVQKMDEKAAKREALAVARKLANTVGYY